MFVITSYVCTDLSVIKYMFVRSFVRSLLVFCSIICLVKDKLVEAWTARVKGVFRGVGSGLGAGQCCLDIGSATYSLNLVPCLRALIFRDARPIPSVDKG